MNKKKIVKNKKIYITSIIAILVVIFGITIFCLANKENNQEEQIEETVSVETDLIPGIDTNLENTEEGKGEISEDNIDAVSEEEIEEEKQEEEQKQEQNNTAKSNNNEKNSNSGGSTYYIKVNYTANVVTVYKKDDAGNYTVPVKAMICSTGVSTPRSGVYSVKTKWTWGKLFGNVWGHYTTKIVGNILFHSVPYLSNDPSTLEYWEYDKLGTAASAGCVRLKVIDAKWIFDNMPYGTPVEFYSDSNPGPLGKPGAQKISGNEACRGWDPTDPSANNPWKKVEETPKKEEKTPVVEQPKAEVKENTTNNTTNSSESTTKNTVNNTTSNNTIVNNTTKTPTNTTTNTTTNITPSTKTNTLTKNNNTTNNSTNVTKKNNTNSTNTNKVNNTTSKNTTI